MKVLMIEHFLPGSIYTLELSRELKNYCEVSIFCKDNVEIREEEIHWLPYFYSGGKGKAGAILAYGNTLRKLAAVIRKGRFDVVHIQAFKDPKYEIPFYGRIKKHFKKLVHTVHNVLPHEADEKDLKLFQKFYDVCDELIVHNQASKDCLLKTFRVPESKITIIAHGAYQTHMEENEYVKRNDVKEFLQFGFIRKYKGIDILLEAAALLDEETREKIHITIAGQQYPKLDGTDYRGIIREKGIEDFVTFSEGHIPEEEVSAFFGKADFLLFPYRNIYGSGALLLAYTYKKPVIVSDIPAFEEETDHGRTGLLFESENPQSLADAIRRAVNSSETELEGYQSAISELVTEKYNWKKSAMKTAEIYKK